MTWSFETDSNWVANLDGISVIYTTDEDDLETVMGSNYFGPGHPLPGNAGVNTIIRVTAVDHGATLVVTQTTGAVKTAFIDSYAVGIAGASLPLLAFSGEKWDKQNPPPPPDNARAFEIADTFRVPVYVGPGNLYTSIKPRGAYYGEGVIHCPTDDGEFTYGISLSATPVKLDTAIELLEWKTNLQGEVPPHETSADDYEQSLNIALGPRAGARFAPETDSSVAVGYKALSNAGGNCESSTAVGSEALGSCGKPIRSEAIGAGALADSNFTNRSTCMGNGAGRWAGCADPVRANHDYFHANYYTDDEPTVRKNTFDQWNERDPNARRDLVGPITGGDPNFDDPNTVGDYIDGTVPDISETDEDTILTYNSNNVFIGRDAGNHNVIGTGFSGTVYLFFASLSLARNSEVSHPKGSAAAKVGEARL